MREFERPAIALMVGILTKRIKIGSPYRLGGTAYVRDWTRNKRTEFQVRYISGKEVDIYNPENELRIQNIGEFAKSYVRLQIYCKQYESEILIDRLTYGEDRVEGEVKRGSKEIYRFRFEVNEYRDLRLFDDESFGDDYRGYRQYELDF